MVQSPPAGGPTGTGAAPIIASLACVGALRCGRRKPFSFEGKRLR